MHVRTPTFVAIATALPLGLVASAAHASLQDAPPTGDHSADVGQAVSDGWITTKVKAELATTKGIQSTDVSVTTVDGTVTLTGVLPTRLAVKKAIAVTRSIKGVKDVDAAGLKAQ
ncbi:MAG TPA: BON domain-containing protein [Rhodanobacteraceae bacterium]|nr:BON domain-containing protein [Rhodanobacteraceae bacterium]